MTDERLERIENAILEIANLIEDGEVSNIYDRVAAALFGEEPEEELI